MTKRIQALILSALFIAGMFATTSQAQVTASIANISGATGETVSVPVSVSGLEGTDGFNSFSFTVNLDNANGNIAYLGHDLAAVGTIIDAWSSTTSRSNSGNSTLTVGGWSSGLPPVAVSGTLLYLKFTILGTDGGGSVALNDFRLAKSGAPLIWPYPQLIAGLNVFNRPVAVDDAYGVIEGGTIAPNAATGVLANDTDADLDVLIAVLNTNPVNGFVTLNADGSFSYTHNGSETLSDSFTYTVTDGSSFAIGNVNITVTPQNDIPVFTAGLSSQEVFQGAVFAGDFDATDGDGDPLTYAILVGPVGATIDASTGVFSWTADSVGNNPLVVTVSDGTATVQSALINLSVNAVEKFSSSLYGWNQPSAVLTSASGNSTLSLIPASDKLSISAAFSGLSSPFAVAELGLGAFGVQGTFVHSLAVTLTPGMTTSGLISEGSNLIDLNTLSFPAGIDKAGFIQGLRDGNVFLNIRTINNLNGEIRGQFRISDNSPNQAPTVMNPAGPLTASITGDPANALFAISWTGSPSDADSDPVRLFLSAYKTGPLVDLMYLADVTNVAGSVMEFTVAESAAFFDKLTGGSPGLIQLGGTTSMSFSLIASDGSASATSSSDWTVDLTRRAVTAIADEGLPADFVLKGNYPNPFNPSTAIQFDLPAAADVQIDVLDLLGRTMISIPSQSFDAGSKKSVSVDASALSSGIYMYRVIARTASDTFVSTGTMTLIK